MATDINPYASPAEAGGYDERQRLGVGVWRDGRLLVMHQRAVLPRFCVHTGERAVGGRKFIWKPGNIFTGARTILIPLCGDCIRDYQRLCLWSFAGFGCGIAGLLVSFAASWLGDWRWVGTVAAVALGVVGALVWVRAVQTLGWRLAVVRIQGDYFWLTEVHPGLLRQLPEWPAEAP